MRRYVLRAALATALVFGVSTLAVAQYGGGGGMGGGGMPGSPTYTPHGSYSSKGAIIGGVAGGAAVGAGLLYWKLHSRAKLQGCVTGDGNRLVNEKNNQTYSLMSKQNETLKPGERVQLQGKTVKTDAGEPMFEVYKVNRELGQCTATTAEQR
jgi:hypothetical protein